MAAVVPVDVKLLVQAVVLEAVLEVALEIVEEIAPVAVQVAVLNAATAVLIVVELFAIIAQINARELAL